MQRFHGCALRRGRVSQVGQVYLVTAVTTNRRCYFADFANGSLLARSLYDADQQRWTTTHAYVVMPDHFHWLFELMDVLPLSEVIQRVKGGSAHALNQRLLQSDRIWQKGYHEHAMRDDEDVLHAARYVVMNPLRAGLVQKVGEWPFWDSSFLSLA